MCDHFNKGLQQKCKMQLMERDEQCTTGGQGHNNNVFHVNIVCSLRNIVTVILLNWKPCLAFFLQLCWLVSSLKELFIYVFLLHDVLHVV